MRDDGVDTHLGCPRRRELLAQNIKSLTHNYKEQNIAERMIGTIEETLERRTVSVLSDSPRNFWLSNTEVKPCENSCTYEISNKADE